MSAQKNKKCKNSRQGTLIKELQLEPTELVILKIRPKRSMTILVGELTHLIHKF